MGHRVNMCSKRLLLEKLSYLKEQAKTLFPANSDLREGYEQALKSQRLGD